MFQWKIFKLHHSDFVWLIKRNIIQFEAFYNSFISNNIILKLAGPVKIQCNEKIKRSYLSRNLKTILHVNSIALIAKNDTKIYNNNIIRFTHIDL